MKSLSVLISLAALGGCAVAPPGPAYYGSRVAQASYDPYQWHVVSSEPVYAPQPAYTSQPVYATQPVYAAQRVYVQQPAYYAQPAYYYPQVTIGLDFMFGRRWGGGGHRGWGRGNYHGHR
ncbi:MAG TPA: hypothetical protein DCW29_11625 [Janthinobacterium sp.]|nr:hypothetical protein [Janthinobacterium sp.]